MELNLPSESVPTVILGPRNINEPGPLLEINSFEGQLLVRVWADGRIDYGEDYTPDEAARIFWTQIAKVFDPTLSHMPGEVALQGHALLKITGPTPIENSEE